MLKAKLRILQVGQVIWATVEELQGSGDVLVNYQGDLLRVQNLSSHTFRPGQRVRLEVMATLPLEFRHRPVTNREERRLDIDI